MIAVRPPEYLPGLAYCAMMFQTSTFVLADTFQYSRQSFQNRTKVRNPQGWQWVSVPLKGGQHGLPIQEVRIRPVPGWLQQHRRAFEYNYRGTSYFEYYEPVFMPLFETSWTHLSELTCASVACIHHLFQAPATLVRASTLPGHPSTVTALCQTLEATDLLVPPASVPFDQHAAASLHVANFEHPTYRQAFKGFEPGMTALDLLFNYGPEAAFILRQHIQDTYPVASAS